MNNLTPDHVLVATLHVRSPKIEKQPDLTFIEDPILLKHFESTTDCIAGPLKGCCVLGDIRITEGGYVRDIHALPCIKGIPFELEDLVIQLGDGKINLENNAQRAEPRTATMCGIAPAMLKIFQAANELSTAGAVIEIIPIEGPIQALPTPSSEALIALPAQRERKPKKINGMLNAIGWDINEKCKIQVSGNGEWYSLPEISIDKAYESLKRRTTVTGVATWQDEIYVLHSPEFMESMFS